MFFQNNYEDKKKKKLEKERKEKEQIILSSLFSFSDFHLKIMLFSTTENFICVPVYVQIIPERMSFLIFLCLVLIFSFFLSPVFVQNSVQISCQQKKDYEFPNIVSVYSRFRKWCDENPRN